MILKTEEVKHEICKKGNIKIAKHEILKDVIWK